MAKTKHKWNRTTNADPASIKSPLAPILGAMLASVETIAPNRADDVREFIPRSKVRFALEHKPQSFDFGITRDRFIRTSVRGLEHFWGALFAYQQFCAYTKARPSDDYLLDQSDDGRVAQSFVSWAFGDPIVSWPNNLPTPSQRHIPAVDLTNKIFLISCGFIMLHEFAHLVLGHLHVPVLKPEKKIAREYQADDWAVDFVVKGTDPADLPSRLIAMAFTFGSIGGNELYGTAGEVRTHPFPPDRIVHFLGNHLTQATNDPAVHAAVALAAAVPIRAHLLRRGIFTQWPRQSLAEFFAEAKTHYIS